MPQGVYPHKKRPVKDRFWEKVKKTKTCWEWTGYVNEKGYGQISIKRMGTRNHTILAHRLSWQLNNGPISNDGCVLHKCDNPKCVRPSHLWLGTIRENNSDMCQKRRNNFGERNGHAKLTWESVAQIKKLIGKVPGHKLAKQFKISQSQISEIKNGRAWIRP